MKRLLAGLIALFTLTVLVQGASAQRNKKKKPPKAKVETTDLGDAGKATSRDSSEGDKQVKVIDFTGLALSGRIRTPQLLYFLNRIRQELEAVQLEKRSFMPELARSVNDDAL